MTSPAEIHAANPVDDGLARRNTAVLVTAQAVIGAQLPMIILIGGLVGQQLAPNACLATLPISLMVFGSMTTAPWLSTVMQRYGRRAGFQMGVLGGLLGAAAGAVAVVTESFLLLLLGAYLTGVYMSAHGFFRFAATDTASEAFRPKAISYVMAGGLAAAIIGPQLVSLLTGGSAVATAERYLPVFYGMMAINVLGLFLFYGLKIPVPPAPAKGASGGRSRRRLLTTPAIMVSVICAAVSYALMNLVMTSTPLAVVGCGFAEPDAANIVSAHVIAMYLPSFFTGHLITRFGSRAIVSTGLLILAGSGAVAIAGVDLPNFFVALVLLGIGWNFGFIGATSMLADHHGPEERGRVQGMNDMIVFGCVTVASLASGGLMNCTGGLAQEGWTAVNLAMYPLLALAGGALIWLTMRPADPATDAPR